MDLLPSMVCASRLAKAFFFKFFPVYFFFFHSFVGWLAVCFCGWMGGWVDCLLLLICFLLLFFVCLFVCLFVLCLCVFVS